VTQAEGSGPRAVPLAVLTLVEYYLPGYKAGGPLRTVENMVARLVGPITFRIITRDRDCGDERPYPDLVTGRRYRVGNAEVQYLASRGERPRGLRRAMRETPHDVLYLNSLFSTHFSLRPLLLRAIGAVPRRPVVVAPRGELHPGALGLGGWPRWVPPAVAERLAGPRALKKRLYIALGRRVGLFRDVVWQASNDEEGRHVRAALGEGARVIVAPDLAPLPDLTPRPRSVTRRKRAGELRVMFLSRIDPKKNLAAAIAMLRTVRGAVHLDIYGPVEDGGYWATCQEALRTLPANITSEYRGALLHDEVGAAFSSHHLFLFPTLGENFGHVLLESLVNGCPVLTSDRTPWRGLEAHRAGWDLSLDDHAAFSRAVQRCVDMSAEEFRQWSRGAEALGARQLHDESASELNRALFAAAVRPR